jgi:hypothetical protein
VADSLTVLLVASVAAWPSLVRAAIAWTLAGEIAETLEQPLDAFLHARAS